MRFTVECNITREERDILKRGLELRHLLIERRYKHSAPDRGERLLSDMTKLCAATTLRLDRIDVALAFMQSIEAEVDAESRDLDAWANQSFIARACPACRGSGRNAASGPCASCNGSTVPIIANPVVAREVLQETRARQMAAIGAARTMLREMRKKLAAITGIAEMANTHEPEPEAAEAA